MDTINTIITNAQTLAHAPIDWSPDGGVVWFLGSLLFTVGGMFAAAVVGDRERRREELYAHAEAEAHLRLRRMEKRGYIEIINR